MKGAEKERLSISMFSAVVLHLGIVLLLGLVDLSSDGMPRQHMGPVEVRLQSVAAAFTSQTEEPELASPVKSEPDSAAITESAVPAQVDAAKANTDEPAGTAVKPRQPETRSAVPFWEAPKGTVREFESGPASSSRIPSGRETQERPASLADEAPDYGEEISERTSSFQPGESRVVTEKGVGISERTEGSRGLNEGDLPGSSKPVLSDDLQRQISGITSAGSPSASAGSAGGTGGERSSSGETEGQGRSSETVSTGESAFRIEGIQDRDLLSFRLPVLTDSEKAQLPRYLEIAVEFDLMPNGIPTNVHLTRGASTGHPEIDSKLVEAVRSWKFSSLPTGRNGKVTGIARILIRAK